MTSEFIFICVNGKGGRKIFLIYIFEKSHKTLKSIAIAKDALRLSLMSNTFIVMNLQTVLMQYIFCTQKFPIKLVLSILRK